MLKGANTWGRVIGSAILAPVLVLALLFAGPRAWAQSLPTADLPTLITADELEYDSKDEVVVARGDVEISQGERVLMSDRVSYDRKSGIVTAEGNVTLLEPSGDVVFAEYVELGDDLRNGFIRQIRVLLEDKSRMAAASAERVDGRYIILRNGVYSPCELCAKDPTKAPLWQIKAEEVVHDQEEKTIEYRDAWMEIFGLPVAYTPYFSHPDPTVDRASGFLAPSIGGGDNLGATIEVPYYWVIDETSDLTFAPIFTTKQSIVLGGEYRKLFTNGALTFAGSGTIADRERSNGTVDSDVLRGHVDATGRFDLDPTWRTGFDLQRATDDTYLRLYDFSAERTLTSRLFVEGFRQRNYASANAFVYQGLRDIDNNDEFPIVAPSLGYSFVGEPSANGGKYFFDGSFESLNRIEGRDTQRLGFSGGYEFPFTGRFGEVLTLTAQLEGALYITNDFDRTNPVVNPANPDGSDFTGHALPQLAAQWRYPWIQENDTWQQILEPTVQMVLAPPTGNPDDIPNEDSVGIEFDDANFFALNRFPGVDRLDPGTRVDYGLTWRGNWDSGAAAEAFMGQSYQIIKGDNEVFPGRAGVGNEFSDLVGRLQVAPTDFLDFFYSFRLDDRSFAPRRSELDALIGGPAFQVGMGFLFVDERANLQTTGDRKEIDLSLSSQITENWRGYGGFRRDLERGTTLNWSVGLGYEDECLVVDGVFKRRFFNDRELDPDNTFFIRFEFKSLGEFRTP